jgi:GTPase SAR1 family protein
VYDVTSRSSFEALPRWVAESQECGADNMVIVVAGTKSDLLNRKVTEKEAKEWASAQGFLHFEVSAQSSQVRAKSTDLSSPLDPSPFPLPFLTSLTEREGVVCLSIRKTPQLCPRHPSRAESRGRARSKG